MATDSYSRVHFDIDATILVGPMVSFPSVIIVGDCCDMIKWTEVSAICDTPILGGIIRHSFTLKRDSFEQQVESILAKQDIRWKLRELLFSPS